MTSPDIKRAADDFDQAAEYSQPPGFTRREFLGVASLAALAAVAGCRVPGSLGARDPIIDIHQHVG